jgi:hypothetical protein
MRTRAVEYMLALLQLAWGLAVVSPLVTLSGPNYRTLTAIAPEVVWGNFAIAIGGLRLAALIINGQWRRTPLLRAIGAGCGVMWWIVLGGLYVIAANEGAPVVIFFEFFSMYRCGIDIHEMGALRSPRVRDGRS